MTDTDAFNTIVTEKRPLGGKLAAAQFHGHPCPF